MIVRILGEGQFDVPDARVDELNHIDDALVGAIDSGDEETFAATLAELLRTIRHAGTPAPVDSLKPSDLVLPRPDSTIEEVRALLSDDGLIPG